MIYKLADHYYVRNLKEADLEGSYPSWFENQDVCRFNSHGKFFKNTLWFRAYFESLNKEDKLVWAICHEQDGHIGNISLQNISFINKSAEFAILIGNSNHWQKYVGLNASITIIGHGFLKLNLHRVFCGTAATNIGMQKLAARLGMTEEGRRRKHLYLNGAWEDQVDFGLLRDEFIPKFPLNL